MAATLATRIADRLAAEYTVPADILEGVVEELVTIARGRKLSAAKLPANVISDTISEYLGDSMTDEVNEAALESIREGMADEDDNAQKLTALKAQKLTPADEPTPKATKARKAKDDAPKESRKGAHADCDHETTKAARARCRRERAKALAVAA